MHSWEGLPDLKNEKYAVSIFSWAGFSLSYYSPAKKAELQRIDAF